ncbi:GlxA family transcriptional regulator [Nocardioides sp.]|uniref:GlxA family transcriptional regulator n=1 Tax=Nocardioides sp. TaxID=35761 RepID=UPI0035663E20
MSPREYPVTLVVFEGAQLLDIAGPLDVLDAAARGLAGQGEALLVGDYATPEPRGGAGYRVQVASLGGVPVRTSCGLLVVADRALEDLIPADVDTLIVAGSPFIQRPLSDQRLIEEIARLAGSSRRTASVCTGAFLLAAAGVLDGKRATTHWANGPELARRYPAVSVEVDRIFIQDQGVFTSAGVTAGIDMALSLVEDDFGSSLALTVARWLVMFLRRAGGQSQYSERLALPANIDPTLQEVIDEVIALPTGDHRLPTLAGRLNISERHLSRLFVDQTGVTPGRFVERVRVEAARTLLERTDTPITQIAESCGLGSPETLRRAFLRVLGVSPSDYRARFPRSTHLPLDA